MKTFQCHFFHICFLFDGLRLICTRSILIAVLAAFFFSSCTTSNQPINEAAIPTVTLEPTSVVLLYPSPVPSPTQQPTPYMTPTLDPGANDLPEYYGGLVITLDNVGETLKMRPQGGFLLRLGEEFQWDVTLTPQDIITLNQKVSLGPGEQGVFIARKKGSVILRAVGEPVCLANDPPCGLPSVLFQMNLLVE